MSMHTTRLGRAERRAALVDAAAELIAAEGLAAVSMESVADRAGVSRPLVYKHFANRTELLIEVLRREWSAGEAEIEAHVRAADGLAAKLHALVHGYLRSAALRGDIFTSLRAGSVRDPAITAHRRERDIRTIEYFAAVAVEELGVRDDDAQAALHLLLAGLDQTLRLWILQPGRQRRRELEDLFVRVVVGGLEGLTVAGALESTA